MGLVFQLPAQADNAYEDVIYCPERKASATRYLMICQKIPTTWYGA